MLPKSVIACAAATAFVAATALIPTGASAAGAMNWPQEGTWNWPPSTGSTCGYMWVNSHHKPGNGHWTYQCQ